ncbi:hypothetical protein A3F34_01075 [Candidatus Roizmanbacteria bacterium RIFCSPHIGHO2_12_FULL_44_10]|uniref:Uncharacterized protein n=1 Tax=Candidatus Roizmanbacteria bacterium RIFCSPHIGHO2_12_FULL_44_10 TaxID=1802054 RepID=A0A1F7I8W5_9BACT|nr:MAG: hypothetical protein A3F34_01075 [Candidatus Roizmanbacteria bacterium RIFCSPHIGHO2_12_FULL_44_10]
MLKKASSIKEALKSPQVRDYSYAILFFLVSSFFAFFVIRPVLSIAISLRKEGIELQKINETYEKNIAAVLKIQANLEEIRPRKQVIDTALPSQPELNGIIKDIRSAAAQEGIAVLSLSVSGIEIKSDKPPERIKPNSIEAEIDINADFNQLNSFIHAMTNQRRIKTIKALRVRRELSTGSEQQVKLHLTMNIETYYLPDLAEN